MVEIQAWKKPEAGLESTWEAFQLTLNFTVSLGCPTGSFLKTFFPLFITSRNSELVFSKQPLNVFYYYYHILIHGL